MRKLASIQLVGALEPIAGADNILCASVQGWRCVVKKSDALKVGDMVVFFEIDSICPMVEPFLFLKGERIRTKKLRGCISQGLALALSYFPILKGKKLSVGEDLTERLKITKYEPPQPKEMTKNKQGKIRKFFMRFYWFRTLDHKLFNRPKGGWPQFIPKTDEERVQNIPEVLQRQENFYASEKVDGSSSSYFYTRKASVFGKIGTFGVCSRNIYLKTKDNSIWWKIAKSEDIERKLKRHRSSICIHGEIVGPGVQGNKYKLQSLQLFVFGVWDIDKQEYYDFWAMRAVCDTLGFRMVPVISDYRHLPNTIDEIVKESVGVSVLNPNVKREGLVFRTMSNDNRVSFKVVNPNFLLEYDE